MTVKSPWIKGIDEPLEDEEVSSQQERHDSRWFDASMKIQQLEKDNAALKEKLKEAVKALVKISTWDGRVSCGQTGAEVWARGVADTFLVTVKKEDKA